MKKIVTILAMVFFLGILIFMVIQLYPLVHALIENVADETRTVSQVNALGSRAIGAFIGLSALQVIIPFIPAPAVGILAGLSFGIVRAPFIYLTGIMLGNLFVIFYIRQVEGFLVSRRKEEKPKKENSLGERLKRIKRPEIAAFFLFLLPWVSGVGPYLFARTKVVTWKYLLAVLLGSLPSTIMYIFLGDRISGGHTTTAIITGVIVVLVTVTVLIFRKRFMDLILA